MIVLDAGAMIDYLAGEPGGKMVRECLQDADMPIYAHALNLAEVFYHFSRLSDVLTAREALATLEADGFIRRDDMDAPLCEDAAQIKAEWRRVSLADCFGLALARRENANFFTTDHHEPDALDSAGVCDFTFTR